MMRALAVRPNTVGARTYEMHREEAQAGFVE